MKLEKKKAFTLIELIIVIAIIAILVAVAIPKYSQSRKKAQITAHNANVQMLKTAGEAALLEDAEVNWSDTNPATGYVDKWPKLPKGLFENFTGYTVKNVDGTIVVTPDEIEDAK